MRVRKRAALRQEILVVRGSNVETQYERFGAATRKGRLNMRPKRLTAETRRARRKNEELRARWEELRREAGGGNSPPEIIETKAGEEPSRPIPSTSLAQVRHVLLHVVARSSEPPHVPPNR